MGDYIIEKADTPSIIKKYTSDNLKLIYRDNSYDVYDQKHMNDAIDSIINEYNRNNNDSVDKNVLILTKLLKPLCYILGNIIHYMIYNNLFNRSSGGILKYKASLQIDNVMNVQSVLPYALIQTISIPTNEELDELLFIKGTLFDNLILRNTDISLINTDIPFYSNAIPTNTIDFLQILLDNIDIIYNHLIILTDHEMFKNNITKCRNYLIELHESYTGPNKIFNDYNEFKKKIQFLIKNNYIPSVEIILNNVELDLFFFLHKYSINHNPSVQINSKPCESSILYAQYNSIFQNTQRINNEKYIDIARGIINQTISYLSNYNFNTYNFDIPDANSTEWVPLANNIDTMLATRNTLTPLITLKDHIIEVIIYDLTKIYFFIFNLVK
jgi:hypothetical protein